MNKYIIFSTKDAIFHTKKTIKHLFKIKKIFNIKEKLIEI